MKKLLISTILLLILTANVFSKNINISREKVVYGIIMDNKTLTRITGAAINYNGKVVYSDQNGKFMITLPTNTELTLTVDFIEYDKFDYKIAEVCNSTIFLITLDRL